MPSPLERIVPGFVGNFSYGREYDLLPVGDAKAGVMICFESHFGQLSREYVRNGADVIIEMTNDGYLGPTPVLRQHLANAVFRAVETNRPVLRVTNVGITAYINENGQVLDAAADVHRSDPRLVRLKIRRLADILCKIWRLVCVVVFGGDVRFTGDMQFFDETNKRFEWTYGHPRDVTVLYLVAAEWLDTRRVTVR